MPDPLVVAVMLTKDRPQMAKRAVECFRKQTYQNKRLLIFDTSDSIAEWGFGFEDANILHRSQPLSDYSEQHRSIGHLRNCANALAVVHAEPKEIDIFLHFDDDDYSHPNRISEQVALLQASGKQCVGYRDMLFWRTNGELQFDPRFGDGGFGAVTETEDCIEIETGQLIESGEAWLYHNDDPRYCLGTSLCYWRETWETRPFKDISRGEDKEFLRDRDTLGVSSLITEGLGAGWANHPAMIASIHSGNHVVYDPERSPGNYKRVPEWDAYCRERMAL